MPRGKKAAALSMEDKIAAHQKEKESILAEMASIEAQIALQKQLLKAKKKEAQRVDKDIADLRVQKENEDAIRVAVEQKAAITEVVTQLMQDGKTADDILRIFCMTW